MGSQLQLLNLTRWEVFCLKFKMQFLVLLLSATLATVAYGAANAGGHHFGHAYHDGPHCHDQKDHQCHKTPKQQEHEECFVESDVVDAHHEDYAGDYHKRSANPGDHGHSSGPY